LAPALIFTACLAKKVEETLFARQEALQKSGWLDSLSLD